MRLDHASLHLKAVLEVIEETPRERLLEEVGQRVLSGRWSYRDVLAGLQLAGVRNVQPRPVGFKFHCVMMSASAFDVGARLPEGGEFVVVAHEVLSEHRHGSRCYGPYPGSR